MNSLQSQPMGILGRLKVAAGVVTTGKLPNPMASEPKDRSRAAFVRELNDWCVEERKFWKPIFERIRQEQKFAAGKQWEGQRKTTEEIEDYIGDVTQQLLNRKTATLYGKNPTPEAVMVERLNYTQWDGNQATIDACKQLVATIAPQAMQAREAELQGQQVQPPPPQMMQDLQNAEAILNDYNQGMQEKQMYEKIARTAEFLIKQQWGAQSPNMLISAKQAVVRIITSRVCYVKVMYKRDEPIVASESANQMNLSSKIQTLQANLAALKTEQIGPDDPERGEAKLMAQSIQQEIDELKGQIPPPDEGIVLDWPKATSVIIDRRCTCLKEFIGAHRVAHEMMMTVEECEAKFKVNLRDSGARLYSKSGAEWRSEDRTNYDEDQPGDQAGEKFRKQKVCVWHIEDKDTGESYFVCDGVKDFLQEPEKVSPTVNRFWSIVPITFNATEIEENEPDDDCTIYPRSDVRLMMPMQININTAGQDKRKHRSANRPAWVGVKSKFASSAGQNDLEKLARPREGHDVLMLETLLPGEKIGDFIQPLPKQPFDENLYDNDQDTQAMMLATGMQASDIGEQRPDEKATGQNIAAQARATSEQSNVDDLDFAFSTIAQMCWEMLNQEMDQATVQRLVGRGGVWPDINRQAAADSIYFRISAGSMGTPNQGLNIQKLNVLGPQILQMLQLMQKSPEPLLKLALRAYDSNIDLDDLLKDAQVLPPPTPPPPPQQKPPSLALNVNYQNLTPEEQSQAVTLFGIKPASPASRLLEKVGHANAANAAHENNLAAAGVVPGAAPATPPKNS